ncbi:MAG: 3-dehydroquinate synthase [Chlorobiaceae bacterium]|nr:3-dehydroquinate synthase [Chlorobiaceae bacterium]
MKYFSQVEQMKLHINLKKITDNSYDIIIGTKLSSVAGEIAKWNDVSKYFIITDSNVRRLYGNKFLKALQSHNVEAFIISVPAGEKSKTRKTKDQLENKLLKLNADRSSLIIALGGGVIGDLAGFVAATLLRGIPFIQIPTTLLSQVDSSIGGKVAVDHPLGKNLIGAFYQPKKVYIDVDTLKTLPVKEFRNGMAEIIKYSAILDNKLFSFLENNQSRITIHSASRQRRASPQAGGGQASLIHLIYRCCELKKMIVEKDERETGLRRILNFGHTIGHAIESLSYYKLSHGEAVAIGMVAEAKISAALGLLKQSEVVRLNNLLQLYKLPTDIPSRMDRNKIVQLTYHDKKAQQGKVQYTLLNKIGKAIVGVTVPKNIVKRVLSE